MLRIPGREARALRLPQQGHAAIRGELIPEPEGAGGWIDVSRPVADGAPVWPGDPPWRFRLAAAIAGGAVANVGEVSGTTHAGTHADAPLHVEAGGPSIDRMPLDAFAGHALVVDVSAREGAIGADELAEAIGRARAGPDEVPAAPARILLATGCDGSAELPGRWRGLSPDAARACVDRGVRLVGTDAPSVDAPGAESLPVHRALLLGGAAIVENLALAGIRPGRYEFLALPLRWVGADASPVRAVLRRVPE